jgi:hypothetical protein
MCSSSDQTELVKHETDPEKIAEQLHNDHPEIRGDFDADARTHDHVYQILKEMVGKLSDAELGEIIGYADNYDYCHVAEHVEFLSLLRSNGHSFRSFRDLMEHTAVYILDMTLHWYLNTD